MNPKKNTFIKIVSALCFSCLVLGSSTAGAVSYDSSHYVYRYHTQGSSFEILPSTSGHFCFLSRVEFENADSANEWARCEVRRSGDVWVLEAVLAKNDDTEVRCEAICYNN